MHSCCFFASVATQGPLRTHAHTQTHTHTHHSALDKQDTQVAAALDTRREVKMGWIRRMKVGGGVSVAEGGWVGYELWRNRGGGWIFCSTWCLNRQCGTGIQRRLADGVWCLQLLPVDEHKGRRTFPKVAAFKSQFHGLRQQKKKRNRKRKRKKNLICHPTLVHSIWMLGNLKTVKEAANYCANVFFPLSSVSLRHECGELCRY